jgi:DNA-binding MarR family transcriptional regulator
MAESIIGFTEKRWPMHLQTHKIRILTLLSENLKEIEPALVPSSAIAGRLNMTLPELRQVLKSMEGMGVIETDPDLQYNLITRKGLAWLEQQAHGL